MKKWYINRQSEIELLRIIAMFFIVSNHLVRHGVLHTLEDNSYMLWADGNKVNQLGSLLFLPGGRVGVAVFFILTGFFSIEKPEGIKVSKILQESVFYGCFLALLSIFCLLVGIVPFTSTIVSQVISLTLLPITGGLGWFVTVYVVISIFSSQINGFINNLNKKGMLALLGFLLIVEYGLGNLIETSVFMFFRGLVFYYIGALIKRKENTLNFRKISVIIVFLISWFSISVYEYLYATAQVTNGNMTLVRVVALFISVIMVPLAAISIFFVFLKIHLKRSQLINKIASMTFAIYVLHDSYIGRILFWRVLLRVDIQYEQNIFLVLVLLSTVIVIVICCFLDYTRTLFFIKYDDKIKKIQQKVCEMLFIH